MSTNFWGKKRPVMWKDHFNKLCERNHTVIAKQSHACLIVTVLHQQTQGFGVEPVDLAVVGRLRRPCRPVELADLQTWQLSADSLVNAVNLQSQLN